MNDNNSSAVTVTVAAVGFDGSVRLVLDKAIGLLSGTDAPVTVVRNPESLRDTDVVLIQGVQERDAVGKLLVDPALAAAAVIVCGMPVADDLRQLSRGGTPTLRSRIDAAMRQLTPGGLHHAILLAAHAAGAVADPGDCPDDRPRGRVEFGTPLADPRFRCGVAVSGYTVAAGDTRPVDAVVDALRSRGIEPVVWAGDPGLDGTALPLWLNLTGFTLRGSHAEPRIREGTELADSTDAQIITPVPLQRTPLHRWRDPATAQLDPSQVSMNIAIPELEAALAPWVICGRDDAGILREVPEHVELLADRALRTLELAATPVEHRRISVTVFGHDADGTVGTAAHLDVFASLLSLLRRLGEVGHDVGKLPDTVDELVDLVVGADGGGFRSASSTLATWPAEKYAAAVAENTRRIEPLWGRLPGRIDTTGRDMLIRGVRFGNVIVGVQPSFGDVADPLNVLMADDASPSHSFAAYYLWLEREFGHHAMLHFGTHGALEFMPGRGTGLLPEDWPTLLTGAVPHAYLYAMSNPAEGTIAKRRTAAQLVSYLTPVLDDAGLPGALADVAELLPRLATGSGLVEDFAAALDRADLTEFDLPDPGDTTAWSELLPGIHAAVDRIRRTPVALGLHALGAPMPAESTLRILMLAATYPLDTTPKEQDPLHDVLSADTPDGEERLRAFCAAVIDDDPSVATDPFLLTWWRHLRKLHGHLVSSSETEGLLRSLRGGYVPPAPGGEPARSPESLPTGRNTHGVDPARVPTRTATARGTTVAEDLIESLTRDNGGVAPRQIAMVIWGMDNVKTSGEGIAQAFRMVGAEALPGSHGRVDRYRILSTEELGRPRVDVTCTVSGVGRDLFSGPLNLLDDAIREISLLDEPDELNPVAAHAREQADELGLDPRDAATRIWSAAPGEYGTGVNKLVQASTWEERSDLAEVYLHRMGHAWGTDLAGAERRDLLRSTMRRVDAAFQNIDSTETSLAGVDHYFEFLGGTSAVVESLTGAKPAVYVNHSWSHKPVVETLESAMRLESRTRLLNPKWWRAQLGHGYQGVANIRTRFENTFGFSATADAVDDRVFDRVAETFLLDDQLREELAGHNPAAVASMGELLLEAADRGLWDADDDTVGKLRELTDDLDSTLEGIE